MRRGIITGIVAAVMAVFIGACNLPASAATIYCADGSQSTSGELDGCASASKGQGGVAGHVNLVINVVIGVTGLISFAMLAIGGVNYIIEARAKDPTRVSKCRRARDTAIYGGVGLAISLVSYAIVNFILKSVFM